MPVDDSSAAAASVLAGLARLLDVLAAFAGIHVPLRPLCDDHDGPLAYLRRALHGAEGDSQAAAAERDVLVWACRGGGKTLLAAAATWAEMIRTGGYSVRVLAGSREQGRHMLQYLVSITELVLGDAAITKQTRTSLELYNGSRADVLAHAQTAVRGQHVDTLRCDEIELFNADVFTAALFTPDRPAALGGQRSGGGHLEALSTMHRAGGLMSSLVEQSQRPGSGTALVRWCLLDVLERCPPSRDCDGCPLWEDCGGRAKSATGFVPIDAAIRLKQRVSRQAWQSEAMCRRPSRSDAVFPTFDPVRHVRPTSFDPRLPLYRTMDLGFTNPSVCLWLQRDGRGQIRVIDELVVRRTSLADFAEQIHARTPTLPTPAGRKPRDAVVATFCDPAAGQHGLLTARSMADELRRLGVPVRYQASRIADGLEHVRRHLESLPGEASNASGTSRASKPAVDPTSDEPGLIIAPGCVELIRSMANYRYPAAHENGDPEKPVKDGEHDHAIDALRYFFIGVAGSSTTAQRLY